MHSRHGIAPAGTLHGYWYVKRYVKFNILAHYTNAGRYGLRWCIARDVLRDIARRFARADHCDLQSNTTQPIKLIRVYISGSMRQYKRLNLVYSLSFLVWYSAITGNIALSLRAGFGLCLCSFSCCGRSSRRSGRGCRQKHTNPYIPVHT